jgi:asparagine N-glycosylation enzyme membrane subunit Stt3
MTAAAIDVGKLVELVWAAALAGIVVAIVFALLLLGATRVDDLRRAGHTGLAMTAYAALALLGGVGFVGVVVFGVSVIVSK